MEKNHFKRHAALLLFNTFLLTGFSGFSQRVETVKVASRNQPFISRCTYDGALCVKFTIEIHVSVSEKSDAINLFKKKVDAIDQIGILNINRGGRKIFLKFPAELLNETLIVEASESSKPIPEEDNKVVAIQNGTYEISTLTILVHRQGDKPSIKKPVPRRKTN